MRLRDLSGLFLSSSIVLTAVPAQADSWIRATTQHYRSANAAWRLTIEPRGLTSPLAYFGDQLDGKERPGGVAGDTRSSAIGTMEHCTAGACRRAWRRPLLNDVAPVDAVVTNDGRVITFDNWHSMGFGATAVVIYNAQGAPLRRLSLPEFLPRDYVIALPRTVSSLDWRGTPRALADGRRVAVPVVVVPLDEHEAEPRHVEVVFDLASGVVSLPPGDTWQLALAQASIVLARQRAQEAAQQQRFLQPARAPVDGSERGWHRFLEDAFFRLDRDREDGYPAIKVLRAPTAPDYAASAGWMRDALRDARDNDGALMLGSPSQAGLVDFLRTETRRLAPGALSGPRIYLALDDARFAQAQAMLNPLGAALIQLDPAKPIPQRPERLRAYEARKGAEMDNSLFE